MADGLVWGLYALIQRDISILFYAIFQLTTSGWIVALKLAHRARKETRFERNGCSR